MFLVKYIFSDQIQFMEHIPFNTRQLTFKTTLATKIMFFTTEWQDILRNLDFWDCAFTFAWNLPKLSVMTWGWKWLFLVIYVHGFYYAIGNGGKDILLSTLYFNNYWYHGDVCKEQTINTLLKFIVFLLRYVDNTGIASQLIYSK